MLLILSADNAAADAITAGNNNTVSNKMIDNIFFIAASCIKQDLYTGIISENQGYYKYITAPKQDFTVNPPLPRITYNL